MDGVKLVSSAILGVDCESLLVGGKHYTIFPPTIRTIAGAGAHLTGLKEGKTVLDVLSSLQDLPEACKALSWFICGNDSLAGELEKGTLQEVCAGLQAALSLIGIENFAVLSASVRNVRSLIATTTQ